jgi:predicted GTPase
MHRTKLEEGGPQLSAADARKNIMRAHVVALMLDAEEVGFTTCQTSYSLF